MSARDVWGFSVGYFVFWLARASEPLICTICACGFCRASWRSLGIARWSLRLLLTAALELCPFTHRCAISARDDWGFSILFGYFVFGFALVLGLLRRTTRACGSGVRAVAQLSRFRSWHGGHVRWPVLLIAALSCRPYRASLCHVGQRCLGRQRLGTLCFGSLVRQSRYMHHVCVWLACELALLSGTARWSLRVAIAAGRCAELSPFHLSLCHAGQRCLGLPLWV